MQLINLKPTGKLFSASLVLILSLGLTACGYQLRGTGSDYSLPAKVYLAADNDSLLNATLQALHSAKVATTTIELADLDKAPADTQLVRLSNSQTNEEGVIYANDGKATHWRYSITTEVIIGQGDEAKLIQLSEHQQVDLSGTSSTTNDRIKASAWADLYTRLAQRVLAVIGA